MTARRIQRRAVLAAPLVAWAGASGLSSAAAVEPAGAPTHQRPRLGHWRNSHPEDLTTSPGWLPRMLRVEEAYGELAGHWRNYHAPGDLPMGDEEMAAAAMGKRLHLSWRPIPAGGTWASVYDDATIDGVMRRLHSFAGPDCWLSIEIEPENDVDETPGSGRTTADFRDLWHKVADSRARVGADNVSLVWVLQGFEKFRPLYPALWPGNAEVDVIGHDPYIAKGADPNILAQKMLERTQYLIDNSTSEHDWAAKPILIAEYGCDIGGKVDSRGTAEHRAAGLHAVQAVLDDLASLGVVELSIFDARSDWLEDPPSPDGAAYLALKQATS